MFLTEHIQKTTRNQNIDIPYSYELLPWEVQDHPLQMYLPTNCKPQQHHNAHHSLQGYCQIIHTGPRFLHIWEKYLIVLLEKIKATLASRPNKGQNCFASSTIVICKQPQTNHPLYWYKLYPFSFSIQTCFRYKSKKPAQPIHRNELQLLKCNSNYRP